MARKASYVPKELPMPSFSLGFTDSSQEETLSQEREPESQKGKSPKTQKLIEQLEELVEKIANSGEQEMSGDMKEKCYLWATRVKTYGDGTTNEYDPVCTLNAQELLILSKVHFASLKAATYIEAEIVNAMCLILNRRNIKRFEEEIYCLPPNIVNMTIKNHAVGDFLQLKSKKPFIVEDYPMFILFLNLKKLASHPYTCPSEPRMKLNKFVGYVISKMRVYAGGTSQKKDREIEPPYIGISGQKTKHKSFTLGILLLCCLCMKWLEIIHPENIKKEKYEWDNWTQVEVDHFRVEFTSQILFHEMNRDRDEAIRGSERVRLSKPSSLLLSPYCQIDSYEHFL
ncbi:hypothetical protein Ahy_A09g046073 [Arachis hypogaea]|uniref:Uncharacterized protein n=1 Tax=Arachis hypogaea TaxID=3818 RepID=A0A445BNW7_ARAHY|nr:hypothetical protein Ahy_A09g046073 [Arachis hypogaea]